MVCDPGFLKSMFLDKLRASYQKVTGIIIPYTQSSDYFNIGVPNNYQEFELYLNVSSLGSDIMNDKTFASILQSKYKAYCDPDIDVDYKDFINLYGYVYRIEDLNIETVKGQKIFKEFNLVFVNKQIVN